MGGLDGKYHTSSATRKSPNAGIHDHVGGSGTRPDPSSPDVRFWYDGVYRKRKRQPLQTPDGTLRAVRKEARHPPENVSCRPWNRRDIPELARLARELYAYIESIDPVWRTSPGAEDHLRVHLTDLFTTRHAMSYIACDREEIVGFITGSITQRPPVILPHRDGLVDNAYVTPRWQEAGHRHPALPHDAGMVCGARRRGGSDSLSGEQPGCMQVLGKVRVSPLDHSGPSPAARQERTGNLRASALSQKCSGKIRAPHRTARRSRKAEAPAPVRLSGPLRPRSCRLVPRRPPLHPEIAQHGDPLLPALDHDRRGQGIGQERLLRNHRGAQEAFDGPSRRGVHDVGKPLSFPFEVAFIRT